MAKQEKLPFDLESYFDTKLENTAVLMWCTHIPSFTFAFYINQLYGLNLVRHDHTALEGADGLIECLYTCRANAEQRVFFLIDIPQDSNAASPIFDKMLLIIGPDAFEPAKHIYDETAQVTPLSDYPLCDDRNETLRTLTENGIFESALFDFSDPDRPETTYFHTSDNPSLQKKRAKFLNEQRKYVSDLIFVLDPLLPDYEKEET